MPSHPAKTLCHYCPCREPERLARKTLCGAAKLIFLCKKSYMNNPRQKEISPVLSDVPLDEFFRVTLSIFFEQP